jgi:hypothetical protein
MAGIIVEPKRKGQEDWSTAILYFGFSPSFSGRWLDDLNMKA